jgi:hypothetical protein
MPHFVCAYSAHMKISHGSKVMRRRCYSRTTHLTLVCHDLHFRTKPATPSRAKPDTSNIAGDDADSA